MEISYKKSMLLFTLEKIIEINNYSPIDWNSYFKNNNPIILEIGCGNGHFLINEAINNKDFNYIGIDIKKDRILKSHKKQTVHKLENILWIKGEAFFTLSTLFRDSTIYKIYMTFPDPWHKRKNHKKRLFNENFLNLLLTKLNNNGEFFFVSDSLDYYNWCIDILKKKNIFYSHYEDFYLEKFYTSLFALKWKKENRAFFHFVIKKSF